MEIEKELVLKLLTDLGFPVFITLISVYIVFLTLKFILSDVVIIINKIMVLIGQLKTELKSIESDIAILDILITGALGVKIDLTKFTNKINHKDEH